jgi:hypothetical protein
VFNPKISGIIAGVAFVLSLLIGLFAGSQFFTVISRALILAVVFFVLSSLAFWLISQFLPELLSSHSDDLGEMDDSPGSRVDISIDSSHDEPESEQTGDFVSAAEDSGGEETGNFDKFSSMQGIDQKPKDDYNGEGSGFVSPAPAESAAVPGKNVSGSIDVLPDLESMSGAFTPSSGSDEEEGGVVEMEDEFSSSPAMPEPSRTKKSADPGNFNVQEMASAIQTILRRDEKG